MNPTATSSWWPFASTVPIGTTEQTVPIGTTEQKAPWYRFWGGARKARKSRKASKPKGRVNVFVKEFKMVNGKILVNREMHCVANTRSRKLKCKPTGSCKTRKH